MANLMADEWAEAHRQFDPDEEGPCYYCGNFADLDSGACEECHDEKEAKRHVRQD
jgi:hypothetical protein